MPETTPFLSLPLEERRDILTTLAPRLGRSVQVLEKDIWVCWTLHQLFAMPNHKSMAFKGGTSLSKAYEVIERLSEDVDVTIDLREDTDIDPFAFGVGRNQRDKLRDALKERTKSYMITVLQPYFQHGLTEATGGQGQVEAIGDGLRLRYPSVETQGHEYIPQSILLELGGRNSTTPTNQITIQTDLAKARLIPNGLSLPEAHVDVLAIERTFWEKVTLVHVEVLRGKLKSNEKANRISRHWYDLAQLVRRGIAEKAIPDWELLKDVVRYKRVFYKERVDSNYDACLNKAFRLVPDTPLREELAQDYAKMLEAKMFFEAPPAFEEIVTQIEGLQKTLNN